MPNCFWGISFVYFIIQYTFQKFYPSTLLAGLSKNTIKRHTHTHTKIRNKETIIIIVTVLLWDDETRRILKFHPFVLDGLQKC